MNTIESASDFAALMESDDPEHHNLARSSAATVEVWREVIHKYPEHKFWVTLNHQIPMLILDELSTDEDVSIRMAVARKRKLTPEIIERLAKDESADVRRAVAYHPKIAIHFLEELLTDQEEIVRKVARWRLKMTE